MIKQQFSLFAFRSSVVASCIALLAACGSSAPRKTADSTSSTTTPVTAAAPMPPTGLTATSGNAQASLTWAASSGAASYHVKRGSVNGGPYSEIATSMLPSYTDSSVNNGATYFFVVSAVGPGGESNNSAPASVTPDPTIAIPPVPMSLQATAGNSQVNLTWSASNGATSYHVQRATTSGGPYMQIATATSPSDTDITVSNGTIYYYVVSAANSVGESANSVQVSVTPASPIATPTAPVGLSATSGNAQVSLTWSSTVGATGYHVKRATTSGGAYAQVGAPTSNSYTDTSVTDGTKYYYVVSAFDSAGESANSTPVSATPAAPAPVVVGTCNGLAAPGNWQEISPPGMNKSPPYTGALVTLVDPNNPGTIYVSTSQSGLYKSTNCGASWTKTNTGRNGTMIDQGLVWSAVIDPVNSGTIYALTGYGPSGLWKSTNGGVDWDNVLPANMGMPGFVARIGMDPTDHLHLLLNFHDNCTGGHTPVCFGESKDGGATWTVLDFPPALQGSWGEGWFISPIDATHWLLEAWGLYYTADAGATWTTLDTGGAAGIGGPLYKAADGSLWLSSLQGVLTSTDGAHWTRIANSGSQTDGITGCGNSLYNVVGFQVPQDNTFVYTASMANTTSWSVLQTPGLPQPMVSGANSITCDSSHGVVYVAAQGAGLWRMATGVTN